MPGWVVLLVKFLLDEGSNVLLDIVLFQRLGGNIDGILLHLLRHIGILDNRLSLRHSSAEEAHTIQSESGKIPTATSTDVLTSVAVTVVPSHKWNELSSDGMFLCCLEDTNRFFLKDGSLKD